MSVRYDMSILMKCDQLDVAGAEAGFATKEDFWVALTDASVNAGRFLIGYTPLVVVNDTNEMIQFLRDVENVRGFLHALKVIGSGALLDNLVEAVEKRDEGALSDGLRVFFSVMKILQSNIKSALMPEQEAISKPEAPPLIMLIGDSPAVRVAVSEYLVDEYRLIAIGGHSALNTLNANTNTPELFIIDAQVSGMSGYELAKTIRANEKFSCTPILFLSSKSTREHVLAAMHHGASEYLIKPIEKDELLKKIRHHSENFRRSKHNN